MATKTNTVEKRWNGFRAFLHGVQAELKKCTWPTQRELLSSTMVVVVSVLILSAYVGVCDALLLNLLDLFIQGR